MRLCQRVPAERTAKDSEDKQTKDAVSTGARSYIFWVLSCCVAEAVGQSSAERLVPGPNSVWDSSPKHSLKAAARHCNASPTVTSTSLGLLVLHL